MENRSASSVFSRDYSSLTKQPSQRFSPGMKSTGKIIYHENLDLICIVDPVEHCIVVLDGQNFTLKRKIASKGIRKGCLYNPIGIGFWYDMVIVADSTNHRICYFDVQTGKVDKVLGQEGKLKGEYQYPTDLVVSNGGLVIVIDSGNARIQAFSAKTGRTQWVLLTASKVHRALPKGSIYNPKILMLHKHILHVCGEKPLMHALDVETGMERYKIYLTHCKQPLSIAALSHDDFAVMDGQTDRICIFNQYGILALKLRYRTFSDLRGSLCFHGTQHRIMVANGMHPSLALYPTFKPISFGTVFESVSTRAVYNVYSFLNYKEADTIRTVCKTCEQLFQQLRLSWDLYPLSANDLVLVHQLYNKWATSKMPNNELAMDFSNGYLFALQAYFGPKFWYQNENRLEMLFQHYADKDQVLRKLSFLAVFLFLVEVQHNLKSWQAHSIFQYTLPAKRGEESSKLLLAKQVENYQLDHLCTRLRSLR